MSYRDLTFIVLTNCIALATPLLFAGLGEYVAERAGTLNISVEAMMLAGAFAGIYGSSAMHSATWGLLWGPVVGALIGLVHGNFSHRLQVNTFVVGLTLNVFALGMTSYLLATRTDLAPKQIGVVKIPLLTHLPLIGPALFDQRWPAYLLFVLVPFTWWVVQRSRWGLEVRSIGENPKAAGVTGIHVNKRRRQALVWCGLLAGFGGSFLSVAEVGSFTQNMTAGSGFIVIAAVIFGGWTLRGTIAGCLLFGLALSLNASMSAIGYDVNPQLLVALPYVLPLLAMAFFAKRLRPPAALAQPFERGAV